MAAHRARPVARNQQLVDADQIDRAQHQADDRARAGYAALGGNPGRPESDRNPLGRARTIPSRLRAAGQAAETTTAAHPDPAARKSYRRAREPAADRRADQAAWRHARAREPPRRSRVPGGAAITAVVLSDPVAFGSHHRMDDPDDAA